MSTTYTVTVSGPGIEVQREVPECALRGLMPLLFPSDIEMLQREVTAPKRLWDGT